MRDKSGKRNLLLAAAIVGLSMSVSMNAAYASPENDLWDAINTEASSRTFTLNGDYTLSKSSLGDLEVENFTLEGNNYTVNLNKKEGLDIDDDCTMTIRKTIMKNAYSTAEGAAIYNEGTLKIDGSQFNNNFADDDDGGAIWNDGTITEILTGGFYNNRATDRGGAIFNDGKIGTIIARFVENEAHGNWGASYGGALYNNGTIDSIKDSVFSENWTDDHGGAIFNNDTITSITTGIFNKNHAHYDGKKGGAIYNDEKIGTISADFTYNYAHKQGGAIYNNDKIDSIAGNFDGNYALTKEGGAIYNDSNIGTISANFKNNYTANNDNKVRAVGGAIYNNGIIDSITGGTFDNNYVGKVEQKYGGGAIFNNGSIKTISANFSNNHASDWGWGGAIYNDFAIISISGTFERNNSRVYGGAIHNGKAIQSITADFKYNQSTWGGAISNASRDRDDVLHSFEAWFPNTPIIGSINSNFTGNIAWNSGGAIYIHPNQILDFFSGIPEISGKFTNNAAGTDGGAIYTESNTSTKINADFEGNSALGKGGAVYYDGGVAGGTLTITGNFINNYTIKDFKYHIPSKGGAIYVDDNNLHIETDDTHDITFSGNRQEVTSLTRDENMNITSVVGGESNAIYNNDYVEFNAKEGRTIWMYDGLEDSGDNAGLEWEKTGKGTLAFGEDMKGIKGDVSIDEGTIRLVQNKNNPDIYGTAFYKADEVTYGKNVYINSQNDHIGDFHLGGRVTLKGALHSLIDVNLAEQTADKIIAGGNIEGSGNIVIEAIDIVTGGGSYTTQDVLIADDYTKGKISLGSNINITGEGYKGWALSYATDTGILNFKRGLTLKEVANATNPESRVFSAAENEVITADIGNIGHDNANLIVNMNNYAINGKNIDETYHSGFVTTAGDQILAINDAAVGNFHKTGGNGSFIYDDYGAEININNSTFMDNEATNGGVIYSIGKLNITDSSFYFNKATGLGGAIYSKGDVTVNAVNKEVGFADNIYGSGEFANAIYMEGTEESPITLALNSKNSTNEISIDDEINGSYYNIVINDAEGSLGDIVFYNKVNTGSLTLSKGLLENNGIVTVTSGTNNGSISCDNNLSDVKGDFILDDGGSATPLVFNNNGNFTQNSLTIKSGEFKTDSSNLHITNDIVNDGTLVFNNANSGSIGQNIKGSTTSSKGVVEIAPQDGVIINLNGKSITNNDVKLTSGIFDVTKNADSDGNINITSMGLISGDGTLNLQDNKAGNINLGDIKTADAKDLNVAIDVHFVTKPDDIDYAADVISVNSLTGDGKIHVNDIKMSKDDKPDPVEPTSTSMAVQVATGDTAIENMDFTGTTITNIDKTFSSILLTYDNDKTSGTGGWLTIENTPATLAKAITSFVNVKLYAMSEDETIDDLYLYGDQLAVTTNGANILSTSGDNSKDGIHIADSLETLSFYGTLDSSGKPESKISGFKTAIDNLAGGEVHLENIEMSENTTDVLNAGKLNLDGKNIVNTIVDDTTESMGSTNIVGGSSTIGSIVQKAVNILPDAELNIRADKLSAVDGVDNWGTLNLESGDLASNVFESQTDPKQSVTNIVGAVTNTSGKTIAQKSVTIANTASLTTAADKVTTDDGISNAGKLNLTGGEIASSVSGTGTTNIKGDVTNISRNIIAQKSITIDNTSSLTSFANKLIASDGISNAGDLNLINGELGSDITGSGTTNILDFVETNGKNITQTTVNVGIYQTEELEGHLINDAVITAENINISSYGILTSAADKLIVSNTNGIANAGELNLTKGNLATAVTGAGTTIIEGDVGFADTTTTISQGVHITETGKLTAATTNLTGVSVTNDGTLEFNNAADGLIAQNIAGSDTDSSGVVEIAASDGIKVGLNGKTITNNDVKLSSGIFDVTSIADTNHNINVSSVGNSIIANGGTLSVQDGETGNITLGTVATGTGDNTKNLNVAIDTNFATNTTETDSGITGHSDIISVASLTGDGKIHISDIRMTADPIATEMTAQVATGDTAIENLDFTGTTISHMSDSVGSLLLSYDNDTTSATKGYLTAVHSDLENAITSSIKTKMYSMGNSEPTIDNLTLGGTSLSITTNGHDIRSISNDKSTDSIKIANSGQTLSIKGTLDASGNPETKISGFKIAVDNSEGGAVNLTNIEFNNNTTDILNEGDLNLDGKNSIAAIADNTTPKGTTTVKSGTSTIGSLVQKAVKILSGGTVNIDADKLSATDGADNQGTLNLGGGNLASNIIDSQTIKTGTTNIKGDVTNTSGKTIAQKSVTVADTASLTTDADKVTADGGISNAGNLNLTGGNLASSVNGYGNTNIKGDVTNTSGKTIAQKSVTIDSSASLTTGADNVTTSDGISNAGNLNLTGGDLTSSVNGDGNTNIAGDVKVNGKNIVQTNLNIGHNGTGAATGKLTSNDDIINAANINVTESGTLEVNATSGQILTSDLLKDKAGTASANITTTSGGTVAINTNSIVMVVDNNVSGAGALTLTGNAGTPKSSSNVGTEFYVSPNAVVSSAINLAAGQLNTGDASNITGAISVASDATLNTMNGGDSTFNNTTFANDAQLKADVNALSNKSDNFISPNEPTGGNEYLTDLSIQDMHKIAQNSKSINLSQTIGLNNLQPTDDLTANLNAKYNNVLTPIRKMNANVQMTPEGLMLNFVGTGNKYKDFNPAVMASPVAAQMGGYLTQLNSYDEAFRNMDMYMLMTAQQRQALKYKNKIASLDGGVLYDKTLMRQERAEGWFRPYATFEKVGLKNGPKVENQAYGTFVGGESKMYDLGHGWDGMWGAYAGYNGSHQHYNGINIYQNGGTLGVVGMAYKGNFFTGLTLNAGASAAEAHTMYGHEDLTMLMAGIASKTGYNWELANGKFIIQPSWLMSYSFVNTFDYTNAAGVRMHSSPLNAIQLQPELKFIGNLKNGWQPYASVAMVWNIMDDTKFKANDVTLPELSVKPYVKYGVGVRKTWGERFTGFFQTYLTNGGRNGVGLQAGFTWAFGGGKK